MTTTTTTRQRRVGWSDWVARLLGSVVSPLVYPYIIVKLVSHIYQRVIDLAFSSFRVLRLAVRSRKIPKRCCDVYGSPRVDMVSARAVIGHGDPSYASLPPLGSVTQHSEPNIPPGLDYPDAGCVIPRCEISIAKASGSCLGFQCSGEVHNQPTHRQCLMRAFLYLIFSQH